ALAEVGRRRARADESLGLGEERVREGRAIQRGGTGHGRHPGATRQGGSTGRTPTVATNRCSATLHAFAVRTTKPVKEKKPRARVESAASPAKSDTQGPREPPNDLP